MAGGGDRLGDLPDSVLIHILSVLWDGKQVVRTSLLSRQWRFLWMSVPVSLDFNFPVSESKEDALDYLASIHRELYYWRSCQKIGEVRVWRLRYKECYAKDVDLWFAFKNSLLRKLGLWYCQLNPSGSVNWSSLVSLSFGYVDFKDGVLEKVLSGCPNLECLSLDSVSGIHPLVISSLKLRELTIDDYYDENHDLWLEISAPYIQVTDLLSRYTNEHEQARRFETHNFNCSFPHLKTIKILKFYGSALPLVKYLLKHATVLEKFIIDAPFELDSDVSPDYVNMALEFLSFPRFSPHASVIFSF
ncbi:hypothetical protein HAX54_023790 [Datura stramonium]|uniref:FBD domain-containing protein n=1 Tax=Datura stramonium TaxID=4076 RepID=A0ABS8UWX9_DATST|nr:hypothetical protein [Datura stramonium]